MKKFMNQLTIMEINRFKKYQGQASKNLSGNQLDSRLEVLQGKSNSQLDSLLVVPQDKSKNQSGSLSEMKFQQNQLLSIEIHSIPIKIQA